MKRVLSIDGGGIRGVIPATVLAALEERTGQRCAQLFDIFAGTSTGGILALGLNVPDTSGDPRYSAAQLRGLYTQHGQAIFPGGGKPTWRQRLLGASGGRNIFRDTWNAAQRLGSPFGGNPRFGGNARYFADGLERVLEDQLGDTPLGAACRDVIIPAYDLASASPVIFRSSDVRGRPQPLMREVARATSAGPTYFPPARHEIDGREAVLVDGGLAANNPAMLGLVEAQRTGDPDVLVVSLGTGTKERAAPEDVTFDAIRSRSWPRVAVGVFSSVMDAGSQVQDQMLSQLLVHSGSSRKYWRLQADLRECNFAMDDASSANVRCLQAAADRLVADSEELLSSLADVLVPD